MAAVIRIDGDLATYDQETGLWTSDCEPLERHANNWMKRRRPHLTHLEEVVDFERTAAQYIVDVYKKIGVEGEIVHVDPYCDVDESVNPNDLDSWA